MSGMKALRVGAHSDGSTLVLDEDSAIHCIESIDIATQQQGGGATMKVERVISIGGLHELLLLFVVVVVVVVVFVVWKSKMITNTHKSRNGQRNGKQEAFASSTYCADSITRLRCRAKERAFRGDATMMASLDWVALEERK